MTKRILLSLNYSSAKWVTVWKRFIEQSNVFLIKLGFVVSITGAFQSWLPNKKKRKKKERHIFFTIWNNVSFNIWALLKTASPSSAICLNFLQLWVVISLQCCTVEQTKNGVDLHAGICALCSASHMLSASNFKSCFRLICLPSYSSHSCVSKHWSVQDVTIIMVQE